MSCKILIVCLTVLFAITVTVALAVDPEFQNQQPGHPILLRRRRSNDDSPYFNYPEGVQIEALPMEDYRWPQGVRVEELSPEERQKIRLRRRRSADNSPYFNYPEGVQIEALPMEDYRWPQGVRVEELSPEERRNPANVQTFMKKQVVPSE